MTAQLADLREMFDRARIEAAFCARPIESTPPNTCRYCGKFWRKWAGSKLDGHSKCIVLPWFAAQLRLFYAANPALTYEAVAVALGVSLSVLRSWAQPISSASVTR